MPKSPLQPEALCLCPPPQVKPRMLAKSPNCGKTFRGSSALADLPSVARWLKCLSECTTWQGLLHCCNQSCCADPLVSQHLR